MLLRHAAARLVRVALLLPLLLGARGDCGASEVVAAQTTSHSGEDCHRDAGGAPHSSPDAPQGHQHPTHSGGGHCTAFHSCSLDFSFGARLLPERAPAPASQPGPARAAALSLLSQLPEVPPPRA